ncbi:MAG: three-Cys-motif partner protein TcmP [Anaerolineales bacterium]
MTVGNPKDDNYWNEYDGLQNAKHQLLAAYLGAWFPILASWNGRVLYIDCHAGRGRHRTGHEGSPILAVRTLVEHRLREKILAGAEVNFMFIEENKNNFEILQREIQALGQLPNGVKVLPYQEDYEAWLRGLLNRLKDRERKLAPAFAFIDPYGFDISMELLNQFLQSPRSELVVNFMYRYVDMSMHNPDQADNMDKLFGTPEWREVAKIEEPDRRAEAAINLYSGQLKAKYLTQMNMYAENGTLKYVLVHASNHELGREKIKEAIWKVTPDGSFSAFERDNPQQIVLIQANADLSKLEDRLWDQFAGKSIDMKALYSWLSGELYLKKHLHELLRQYRKEGKIKASGYTGKFVFNQNPTISFTVKKG